MSGGSGATPAATDNDDIRLRVESISGQVLHLRVPRTETVLGLKNRIFSKQGIPVAEQNLMFLEEELKDFHTLEDYNIKDSCTVRLSVGMKGGPINSRRTLYLDDKNTITEMAKILAANDISVVLVPHNGAYHIIPVPSLKRERDPTAPSSSRERRRVTSLSSRMMYTGSAASTSGENGNSSSGEGMGGRRSEENKATKNKMAALQKQLKEKRCSPAGASQSAESLLCCSSIGSDHSGNSAQIAPALMNRQGGQCCASNLQKSILSDAMPPAASSVLVGGGVSGAEAPRKMVVPRLITAHNTISLNVNELNSAQSLASYACATASGAGDGGGAFESSSSYSSGVERNLVLYPSAGPSGSSSNSQGGEAIFVSPYKGLFRCTADTTENASKEDVSSGTGRCSSAAAAPPPTDNSPTVVERSQTVGAGQQQQQGAQGSTGSAGSPPPSSSGLAAAKSQLLPQQTTQPTPNKNHGQQQQQQPPLDDVTSAAKDDQVKVDRPNEEVACPPAGTGSQTEAAPGDKGASKATPGSPPPLTAPPKKKHPRCAVCNKKTGLASSYTCRCGGNFCATHRYAEAHDCAHDYKTEGRQLLEKSNPLIQAVKLQKI